MAQPVCGGEDAVTVSAALAQFPEALARDHILSWSNPGDVVLDPFLIEREPNFQIAQNRIQREFDGEDS